MSSTSAEGSERGDITAAGMVLAGAVGLLGCVGVVAAGIAGIALVEHHDPIAETISRLAIGKYAWVQDAGLDALAVGLGAAAVGMLLWRRSTAWVIAAIGMVLLGVDLVLIAEHNQYAGLFEAPGNPWMGPENRGFQIHMVCVYVLFGLFAAIPLLVVPELRRIGGGWWIGSIVLAGLWIAGGPLYMWGVPTSVDGLVERVVGVVIVAWLSMISWLLITRGRSRGA